MPRRVALGVDLEPPTTAREAAVFLAAVRAAWVGTNEAPFRGDVKLSVTVIATWYRGNKRCHTEWRKVRDALVRSGAFHPHSDVWCSTARVLEGPGAAPRCRIVLEESD